MTIFELWRDLEKLGYHPTLQRENGKMTMRGVYLRNIAAQLDVINVATNYLYLANVEEHDEEIRFCFDEDDLGDEAFVLIAEWNI